jgi:preprotein translocase subunit YajC
MKTALHFVVTVVVVLFLGSRSRKKDQKNGTREDEFHDRLAKGFY